MLTTIIATILIFLLLPILSFFIGWIIGLLIKITIGSLITEGLSLIGIFITKNNLPIFFGTLSTIAMFFNSSIKVNDNN